MFQQLYSAMMMVLVFTVLTGGVYPLVVTVIAQVAFPRQAAGSLMVVEGQVVGSELIGQPFSAPKYFWGRLSATSPVPYHAGASSGSNFGPLHPDLRAAVEKRIAALTADGSLARGIPVDLVTASASGLDPHISPAAAEHQIPRVAQARELTEDAVREVVRRFTLGRQWGVLGEPRVHVARLNQALDELNPAGTR